MAQPTLPYLAPIQLPNPDNFDDWRSFSRELVRVLVRELPRFVDNDRNIAEMFENGVSNTFDLTTATSMTTVNGVVTNVS